LRQENVELRKKAAEVTIMEAAKKKAEERIQTLEVKVPTHLFVTYRARF
jgi:hypothetical protein